MTARSPGDRPFGLPGAARLRARAEFLSCQRGGTKHHTRHFVVFAQPRAAASTAAVASAGVRLGITASRQVGNAVHRNRWKRLVREAVRHLRARYPGSVLDVVVLARKDCEPPSYADALNELSGALARLHKLRGG